MSKDQILNKRRLNTPAGESVFEVGKMAPQALDLEETVLGAILIESGCLNQVIAEFTPELFYSEKNRLVASAILKLYRDNKPVDIVTVSKYLINTGEIDMLGGAGYVSSLTDRVASSANVEYHIKILQQEYLKRSMLHNCALTIKKVYNYDKDVFDIYSELQSDLELSIRGVMRHQVASVNSIHKHVVTESRAVLKSGKRSGVLTGLRRVDSVTSGWQKTDLIILAGRPGMGKTSFAVNVMVNACINENTPMLLFSVEMSKEQIVGRIQSLLSGIDAGRIIKKQLTELEINHIEDSCSALLTAPLYIDDTPSISLSEIKSKARKLVKENGVKGIIIDYLQICRSGLNKQNRTEEVGEISKGLKALAKELQVPVIALSQLSRTVESTSDKKPSLSDLRDSGQIEQDADLVLFCFRPEYYEQLEYEYGGKTFSAMGLFMLIISKHRNGQLGEIPLTFIESQTKITDHADDMEKIDTFVQNSPSAGMHENVDFLKKPGEPEEEPF